MTKHIILKIIFSVFLIQTFSSCSNSNENNSTMRDVIDLESALKNTKRINLSEFAQSIEYVKLETNDSCFITDIREMDVFEDNIFILERNKLYRFDRDGQLLNTISRSGEGPGEFLEMRAFTLFPKKEMIAISERGKRKIMLYKFNGEFISEFKVDHYIDRMVKFGDNEIAGLSNFPEFVESDNKSISFYDLEGDLINRVLDRSNELDLVNSQKRPRREGRCFFNFVNDTLTYWELGMDEVYKITDNSTAQAVYSINFDKGKNSSSSSIISPDNLFFSSFSESKDYLFFLSGVFDNDVVQIAYNKRSKECFNFMPFPEMDNFNLKMKCGLHNDFDGGISISPKFLTSDGRFITAFYASKLIELQSNTSSDSTIKHLSSPHGKKELDKIIENTTKTDNPIIMIVTEHK